MAERRLPVTARDNAGQRHQGEIILVQEWSSEIVPDADATFTIVFAQQPLDADARPPDAASVAVCAPAAPVRLSSKAAETAIQYDAGASAPRLRLPQQALSAYANGSLLAAVPLTVTAQELFPEGSREPLLDPLIRDLLAARGRAEQCWHSLDEALSRPNQPGRVLRPDHTRNQLRRLLDGVAASEAGSTTLERLGRIAEGAAPEQITPSPAVLAEDVAFVRCLREQPDAAVELTAMRGYLEAAGPPEDGGPLANDYPYTLGQLSFVAVRDEPNRLDSMRATFEMFRTRYIERYVKHHGEYWRAYDGLVASLEDAGPAAQALARLNTLRALGRPVGENELEAYERLRNRRASCEEQQLGRALISSPMCPTCGLTFEDTLPSDEVATVVRGMRAALARQQARLASEAIRRILSRGGERLEQFLQIVQTSDLTGLASVLDDELLAFLSDLLSEPVSPTPEALDLFEELAQTYPVVSEEQVDAVIHTLRQLLTEELASQRAADPGREASFRLAELPQQQQQP